MGNLNITYLWRIIAYASVFSAYPLSGNTFRVGYHLFTRNTLGTVFELYQSSENTHRYFHIIKAKTMYRPSYAA